MTCNTRCFSVKSTIVTFLPFASLCIWCF